MILFCFINLVLVLFKPLRYIFLPNLNLCSHLTATLRVTKPYYFLILFLLNITCKIIKISVLIEISHFYSVLKTTSCCI
ncbi:hypothetical protein XENTR_v10012312 [Xenopus tropicalis]|nr:hypothetical protein XENTR_v10012312 [Xenopus tropicalis]